MIIGGRHCNRSAELLPQSKYRFAEPVFRPWQARSDLIVKDGRFRPDRGVDNIS
jgi:hypothetical protein